eukprot:CAMPEP_0195634368 /NCGR_PEP_ID=MMETSP0815-20121206/22661_1 /TAXON_ID=97485 /ORGANISM="Prymnesium parvum, Strain Texoma1" /LENGTH=56 /DNA_ID=CAMNT_0040776131 /DNA_START=624 /DNA_END=791 /DNA_ORIENTATION=-
MVDDRGRYSVLIHGAPLKLWARQPGLLGVLSIIKLMDHYSHLPLIIRRAAVAEPAV